MNELTKVVSCIALGFLFTFAGPANAKKDELTEKWEVNDQGWAGTWVKLAGASPGPELFMATETDPSDGDMASFNVVVFRNDHVIFAKRTSGGDCTYSGLIHDNGTTILGQDICKDSDSGEFSASIINGNSKK